MRWPGRIGCCCALAFSMISSGQVFGATSPAGRQTPGPVTIRGVVDKFSAHAFVLKTVHHGDLQVTLQAATRIVEKGKHGTLALRNGDHVGVRGFQRGQTLTAIEVRIYPVKPRAYSLKGNVTSISANTIVLRVAGKDIRVQVTGATTVLLNHQTGAHLQIGDRVEVRLLDNGTGPTALHIHIFVRKVVGKRVRFHGIIESANTSQIHVRVGSTLIEIHLGKNTSVHLGRSTLTGTALRAGQTVTVYACCAGTALQATSIHIRKNTPQPHATLLKGRVVSVTPGQMGISIGHKIAVVTWGASTRFQVGTRTSKPGDIHVGDLVTVRALPAGNRWQALRIHVPATSRRLRTVDGIVALVSGSNLVVRTAGGKRFAVRFDRSTAVVYLGAASHPRIIRRGDRVRARGYTADGVTLSATHLEVRRAKVKATTVHGTVIAISGAVWIVADSAGARHRVHVAGSIRLRPGGSTAPAAALFVGVKVTVRGQLSGDSLIASSVTLSARTRTVTGRMTQVTASSLTIRIHSGNLDKIELVPTVVITDGARRLQPTSLVPGAFVRVAGFVEPSLVIRAVTVAVEHPAVSVTGIVRIVAGKVALQVTDGERYVLHTGPATHIESSRTRQMLAIGDLPDGAHARVDGIVNSQGYLDVIMMTVRLVAVTLGGRVVGMTDREWTLMAPDGKITVRLSAATPVTQGSHTIAVAEVVIQDEVTIEGYALGGRTVLARKIVVHRRLVGLDGVVGELSSRRFLLQAADGEHTILTGANTVISGVGLTILSGQTVHVSGYLRGDQVVLATRIRIIKQVASRARSLPRLSAQLCWVSQRRLTGTLPDQMCVGHRRAVFPWGRAQFKSISFEPIKTDLLRAAPVWKQTNFDVMYNPIR